MRSRSQVLLWTVGAVMVLAGSSTGRAQGPQSDHQYSSDAILVGSRVYLVQCSLCHGPDGDRVEGVNLRQGRFRRPLSDDDIRAVVTGGVPAAGMPGFPALAQGEVEGVVAYIRAGFSPTGVAVKVGDASRGRDLFSGKGGCAACHRVNGIGPRTAPDLSTVGALRTAATLQQTILDPSGAMLPINRPVRVVTQDGRTIRGRRLNEDTFTVQIIDANERLHSLVKADLKEYEILRTSTMPAVPFTNDELADVLAYLLSLRGGR